MKIKHVTMSHTHTHHLYIHVKSDNLSGNTRKSNDDAKKEI